MSTDDVIEVAASAAASAATDEVTEVAASAAASAAASVFADSNRPLSSTPAVAAAERPVWRGELDTGEVDLEALLSALGDEPAFEYEAAFGGAPAQGSAQAFGGASAQGSAQGFGGASAQGRSSHGFGNFAHHYRYADEDDFDNDPDDDPVYGASSARDLAGSVDDIIDDIANLRGAVSTLLVEQKALRTELINGLAHIKVQLAALMGAKPA